MNKRTGLKWTTSLLFLLNSKTFEQAKQMVNRIDDQSWAGIQQAQQCADPNLIKPSKI